MKLNLYDENLKRVSIIGSSFISCLWSEGYNSTQDFTIELNNLSEYRQKLRPDMYIGRDDRKQVMVIKSVEINPKTIVASGKQATRILDDVNFVGTIQENAVIDNAIISAYNKSDKFEGLEFENSGLTERYSGQISNKSFLELCQIMCSEADIGLKVVRTSDRLVAKLYKPQKNERNIISDKFGNAKLDNFIFSTENLKNYATVLGEGEGETRTRVDVDLSNGERKRQMIVDARDLRIEDEETHESYISRLRARGVEKLFEQEKTWECTFSPLEKDFGIKYDLGDILTVIFPDYKLKMETRIERFTQKAQANKVETSVEVGKITWR